MSKTLFEKTFQLSNIKDEFRFWMQIIQPVLISENEKFISICEYGMTEMVNNIIDHSNATEFYIVVESDGNKVKFILQDNGIGVFQKIVQRFTLDSEFDALLDLVKGKLTTAPSGHSGEGLFFSSRAFDQFVLASGGIRAEFTEEICRVKFEEQPQGTHLEMILDVNTPKILRSIFDYFCGNEEFTFSKTRFSLTIAQSEGNLVARSQAKRIASRLDQFSEVEIDFTNVKDIGQGFADELFRVWQTQHPGTRLHAVNANDDIQKMISHVVKT